MLESTWLSLKHSGRSEFEFNRIDSISIPELHIGLNSKLHRCLILELPTGFSGSCPNVIRDNLSLFSYPDIGYIVIELLDKNYNDLFNDLIISIYRQIYSLLIVDEYLNNFIRIFYKWSEFFNFRQIQRMQLSTLRGLLGELIILKNMLKIAAFDSVNDVLSSWRGPYDQVRDFISNDRDTEVKTTDGNTDIQISSEFQLYLDIEKELHLAVVTLESDLLEGFSLLGLVNEIRVLIDTLLGNVSIFIEALFQKGLTFKNLYEYDNLRFRIRRIVYYDCRKAGFPALLRNEIQPAIYQVTYRLNLSMLSEFIIQTSET